jgi:5-methylcytosine-specific restriction endonuclease McrA
MTEHIKQFRPPTLKTATPAGRRADIAFYMSPRWKALRKLFIDRNPLCEVCERAIANQVHHKKPRKDYPELSYEWSNLQALCRPCHLKQEER